MSRLTLQTLGRKLIHKRGNRGVRETAKEIGISPATLSRVERGYLPDLETFRKICVWVDIDPGELLGVKPTETTTPQAAVHFKKKQTVEPETAQALAQMILAAQRAFILESDEES